MAVPNPGKLILAALSRAIYDWIKGETAGVIEQEAIIRRDGSEPLPARPCVTYKFTSGPHRVGLKDSEVTDPTTGKVFIGGQREMVLSIQTYGSKRAQSNVGAYQLAADLNASLDKPSVRQALRKAGIGVQVQGDVTNLTDLEETEYEERAEFSIRLGVAENVVDDPGYFDQVGPVAETINQ